MATVYLLLACCLLLSSGNAFNPVVYDAKVLPSSSSQCGQSDPFEDDQQLMETLNMIASQLPPPGCNPPPTCRDVLRCNPSASSGYYQIQAANGSAVQVYCDMEGTNCGGEGGWMRVAHINVTNSSSQCPDGFKVETANSKSFCIRNTTEGGCTNALFQTFGLSYSEICGYIRGYGYRATDGFSSRPADGIKITYDDPPNHVWTYAAGLYQNCSGYSQNCPCNTIPGIGPNPSENVGSDYYCEAVELAPGLKHQSLWYTNDPLWDGLQCDGDEEPCCNHPGLPWFNKNLPTHTTVAIKLNVCLNEDINDENIGIERLELYVK